jgi:hypothetical protein
MYIYMAIYVIVMGENRRSALRNPHYSNIHSISVYVIVMGENRHSALRNPHYSGISINICNGGKPPFRTAEPPLQLYV